MAGLDYQIEANTRRCATTGRTLAAGEQVYTALFEVGSKLVRHDFASEVWHGVPPNAFSFWRSRVPPEDRSARPVIDNDVLFDCFQRLESCTEPDRLKFRYVVSLLLTRRKR